MGSSAAPSLQPQQIRWSLPKRPVAAPAADPDITAQKDQARALQIASTQQGLSADTQSILRQFGAATALAGVDLKTPFSSTSGGFANPFVNASGGMVGLR